MIDQFNSNSVPVFLLSTRAGGMGINLTAADTVIIHDLDFNPTMDEQAQDRCHRIGQKKVVTVYKMVVNDTVDYHIYNLQERKLRVNSAITSDLDGSAKSKTRAKKEESEEISKLVSDALHQFISGGGSGGGGEEGEEKKEEKKEEEKKKEKKVEEKEEKEDESEDEAPVIRRPRAKKNDVVELPDTDDDGGEPESPGGGRVLQSPARSQERRASVGEPIELLGSSENEDEENGGGEENGEEEEDGGPKTGERDRAS